jgi:hypothetical protein
MLFRFRGTFISASGPEKEIEAARKYDAIGFVFGRDEPEEARCEELLVLSTQVGN